MNESIERFTPQMTDLFGSAEMSHNSGKTATSFTSEGTHRAAFEGIDWFNLLAAALIWGGSFLSIAIALKPFGPGLVTFGRIALGTLTLGCFKKARSVKIEREDYKALFIVAFTWMAFPFTLFPLAQQYIGSGVAGLLNGSIPIFTAFVASIALRRLPGRNQIIGLVIGVAGILVLGWPSISEGGGSFFGLILVIVACSSYGVATNACVPLAQKYGSVPVFWRCQLIACLLTAPFGLWSLRSASWNTNAALALLSLGVFGTALAFVAMITLMSRVGSTRASSLTYIEAVVALALGVIFRNEKLLFLEVAGAVILLIGAWMVSRADN